MFQMFVNVSIIYMIETIVYVDSTLLGICATELFFCHENVMAMQNTHYIASIKRSSKKVPKYSRAFISFYLVAFYRAVYFLGK